MSLYSDQITEPGKKVEFSEDCSSFIVQVFWISNLEHWALKAAFIILFSF